MLSKTRTVLTPVVAAGCIFLDQGTSIHPEPGSTAASLRLHAFVQLDSLRPNRGLDHVSVRPCPDSSQRSRPPFWEVERGRHGQAVKTTHLSYGTLPAPGWHVNVPARPLEPGAYRVDSYGGGIGGGATFLVTDSGTIHLMRYCPGDRIP
jgi:hypothetical protein